MRDTTFRDVIEGVGGALLMAFFIVTPFLRSRRARWGSTYAEVSRSLPGDDLVPHPKWGWTHAITINAPATHVWPWLVQIGQGRGGFYSYQWLENLVGCDIHNANRIVPEFQHLKVGDSVFLHPKAPPLPVVAIETGRALVLHAGDWAPSANNSKTTARQGNYIATSWVWLLDTIDEKTTRLVTRWRSDYNPSLVNRLSYGPCFLEPIGFTMDRKMLLGIKERAERTNK